MHKFPYTDYHEKGCLPDFCKRYGVKLAVVKDSLQLLDKDNNVLSQVKISFANQALEDIHGQNIDGYVRDIYNNATGTSAVITFGDGTQKQVLYERAQFAVKDALGTPLLLYMRDLNVKGNELEITRGTGATKRITVPYATKAEQDIEGNNILTYAASIGVDGNEVVLKDRQDNVLGRITVPYAETSGESYELAATDREIQLIDKDGNVISSIVVPFAEKAETAEKDILDELFTKSYGSKIDLFNNKVRLLSKEDDVLGEVELPNAIATVQIVGDSIVFSTVNGEEITITSPYSVRAEKDKLNNDLTSYVKYGRVGENGEIQLFDANNNIVSTLVPTTKIATQDNYGNLLADYIKSIVFNEQSDYLVVTHGNGTTDTIVINYATKAHKDDLGNIIKNVYVKTAALEYDEEGTPIFVAYNGEGSEIWRIPLAFSVPYAERAGADAEGNVFTETYANNISLSWTNDGLYYMLTTPDGTVIKSETITLPKATNYQFYKPQQTIIDATTNGNDTIILYPYQFVKTNLSYDKFSLLSFSQSTDAVKVKQAIPNLPTIAPGDIAYVNLGTVYTTRRFDNSIGSTITDNKAQLSLQTIVPTAVLDIPYISGGVLFELAYANRGNLAYLIIRNTNDFAVSPNSEYITLKYDFNDIYSTIVLNPPDFINTVYNENNNSIVVNLLSDRITHIGKGHFEGSNIVYDEIIPVSAIANRYVNPIYYSYLIQNVEDGYIYDLIANNLSLGLFVSKN
jgi:hypothetical protein